MWRCAFIVSVCLRGHNKDGIMCTSISFLTQKMLSKNISSVDFFFFF